MLIFESSKLIAITIVGISSSKNKINTSRTSNVTRVLVGQALLLTVSTTTK